MAEEEKPYRVYRARRGRKNVPLSSRGSLLKGGKAGGGGVLGELESGPYRGPGALPKPVHWGRRIGLGVGLLLVLVVAWGVLGWFSFSSGVSDANARLDPQREARADPQSGLLYSRSTTILLLGTDNAEHQRAQERRALGLDHAHADRPGPAPALLPLDPAGTSRSRFPAHGTQKINAAMQIGGPALAIKTIHAFVGVPINHVVVVNFADFKVLIDRLGGITIDVPKPILSDRFDCPFKTQAQCQKWQGWRFAKGSQHMNGERALIYSRVRVNRLDPSESDVTRGARQQAVIQAVLAKFTSPSVLLKLPFDGGSLVKPLTTDMSAGQLAQFAWVKYRASTSGSIHCRLGGDFGGGGNGAPSEDNPATIAMFLGVSAPQPPDEHVRPGLRRGARAAVGSTSWGSSRFSSSG